MKSLLDRIRGSLTARIFLITTLILCAACTATYLFIAWATPISYQSIESDMLAEKARELVAELANVSFEDSGPLFDRFKRETRADVVITDGDGDKIPVPGLVQTGQDAVDTTEAVRSSVVTVTNSDDAVLANGSEGADTFWFGQVSITSSDWELPFSCLDDGKDYRLNIVASITAVNQAAEAMGRVFPYLLAAVLAISLLVALFYSRYITKPVVRLSGISQRMAGLDFSWSCGEQRADEIGVLGRNLDTLSHRLAAALSDLQDANARLRRDIDRERELERQRTAFFAAASHELKTPITVLKGQLSGMLAGVDVYRDRDKYLARSLAVTGRMEKLAQEMLTVSRIEQADAAVRRDPVDLSGLVRGLLEQADDLALQRGQAVAAKIAPGLSVPGDVGLLACAVSNLLVNALTYSPPGETVSVSLSAGEDGPVLKIENTGAHIPEDALPRLFEAFYRVEASRSRETGGSGLGLYLVKMILERHGASCTIENTAGGVRAAVRFSQS